MQGHHWQPLSVHLWAYCNPPIAHDKTVMRDSWKVDYTAGETSPAATYFEQFECGFFYVPFDLTNERPQSNDTCQWRDIHDLNWDRVSNHSQNDLTSFFKRPLLLVRPGFKPTTTTTTTTTTLSFVQKCKSWLWFAPQLAGKLVVADRCSPTWANRVADFWQKWWNQSSRQLCKEKSWILPYQQSIEGPLLAG